LDRYPRSTDLSWITMAEWLCRTSDRRIALRVPGSSAHLRRGAPAANSFCVCGVLQSSAHALGITERCALASSRPTIWRYRHHSDPGWTAPPIRPDMIFGKDRTNSPRGALQAAWGVTSNMEQRRFFEARSEESGEWLVLDGKRHPPRVICRCLGWNAPKNAALIAAALEAHSSELYSKFSLDGLGRLNEQPASTESGEAESTPATKRATGKSRAS
jgi:hypothetical protein